uniref:LRC40 n=1 Tax=Macrostomum lignano TaxID=282301 RepID=A0A1I8JS24_9PLAT
VAALLTARGDSLDAGLRSATFVQAGQRQTAGVRQRQRRGSLSHRHQQQPPPPQSDLELLADSERQILPACLTNKNPTLRRLYLNNNAAGGTAKRDWRPLLPSCRSELTLDHNCLSLFAKQSGQLEHLRILSASYNPLCALSGLPDQLFAGMPNLKTARPELQQIEQPAGVNWAAARVWSGSAPRENQLTELPDSLANCQRLNLVNLTANRFVEVPPPLLPLLASCLRQSLLLRANPLSPDCLSDELLMQIMAPPEQMELRLETLRNH